MDAQDLANNPYYGIIKQNSDIDEIRYFNTYHLGVPHEGVFTKGIPMLFITTPLLNLNENNINADDFFIYMSQKEPEVMGLLNYNKFGTGSDKSSDNDIATYTDSPFIQLLSNRFLSIDLKDTEESPKQIGKTFYGYQMNLPGPLISSINASQVGVTFLETANATITKLLKLWVTYMEDVSRGLMYPAPYSKQIKILDYTCSIYYFLLDLDGETIKYWCKYTGCTPSNIPYSNYAQEISGSHGDPVQLSVTFNYGFKEDMQPQILSDFNFAMSDKGDLATGNTADSVFIYAGADTFSKMSTIDPYEQLDLSHINRAEIVSEGYSDNPNKTRFKLKFYKGTDSTYQFWTSADDSLATGDNHTPPITPPNATPGDNSELNA